jgi:class 3 adenylate cyclase
METKTVTIDEAGAERFWRRAKPIAHTSNNVQKKYDKKVQIDRVQQNESSTQKNQLHSPSESQANFMSNENMKEIFPFHLVLDENFKILQHGKDLLRLIGSPYETIVNRYAYDLFEIKRPVLGSWDWEVLDQFYKQTFYLLAGKDVQLKAHFIHLSSEPKHVLVTISPDVKNVKQLQDMKLNMSDLPDHSFQREAIFLGEHLLSGIRSSHKLDKLSRKLVNEHNLSNTLLYSMLPRDVAKILRNGKPFEPAFHENVTLLFSDVVGFTDMCSELPPWEIIDMLNRLYNVMDLLAEKFNLYKVETIGDAYMCCSGVLEPNKFHAEDVVNFAIAARRCVSLIKSPLTNKPIRMRIGIHTGSCMSGVVGTLTPRYCLFGDMVNTTSRHESTGDPQKIHCSSVTYEHLTNIPENQGYYNFSPRGLIDMKGKGLLHTYWLDSAGEKNPYVNAEEMEKIVAEVQGMLESRTWRKRRYFHRNNSDASNLESIAALITSEYLSSDENTETKEKSLHDELIFYEEEETEEEGLIHRLQDTFLGRSYRDIDLSDDLLDNIDPQPIRGTSESRSVSSESDVLGASYHSPAEVEENSQDLHHASEPT